MLILLLKTANSGYLTRRLVDVSQDCIITEEDCGTKEGLVVEAIIDDGRVVSSLAEQCLGRVLLEDVHANDNLIAKASQIVDENLADIINDSGVKSVKVRSVLACNTKNGVCSHCYGRDLATGDIVSVGEAVGVIAAQSIGEPGTQLTMRTFHIGGAAQRGSEQSSIIAHEDGELKFSNRGTIINRDNKVVAVNRNSEITLLDPNGKEVQSYKLPYGAVIAKENGAKIKKGDHLAEWDPYNIPIIAESDGKIIYNDLIENISLREKIDEDTGVSTKIVIEWKQQNKQEIKPRLSIADNDDILKEYALSINTVISVLNGDEVKAGDVIARIPKESSKTRDITGGLPRVAELFEARKPKNASVISEIDGIVEFGKDYKTKKKIIIRSEDATIEPVEYSISKTKHLFVGEGDTVKKGDILVDGNPVPHDILRINGLQAFTNYMIDEVQKVYRMQGVKIDNKHIEVIVSMMLKRVEVTKSGDTTLLSGEIIDQDIFEEVNIKAIENGQEPAKCIPVLLGITKASLQTKSFISAASFQETTRVLTDASVQGKYDYLHGLKENIIVGRLIPAGTGLVANKYRKIANEELAQINSLNKSSSDIGSNSNEAVNNDNIASES